MRNSRGMKKKTMETGSSLHKDPRWEHGVVSFSGTFETHMKEGSGNGVSLTNLVSQYGAQRACFMA